ncbi:MAG: non-canonical purine NTP pyrophosphatase, partial [Bacteroidota bacterium]
HNDRTAQFKTVIALYLNGQLHTFTGICKGEILKYKKGTKGFGYDPIFMAEGCTETFAEISLEEKNNIGHRGKAVQKLITFLSTL